MIVYTVACKKWLPKMERERLILAMGTLFQALLTGSLFLIFCCFNDLSQVVLR